jgi:hypothetical protein
VLHRMSDEDGVLYPGPDYRQPSPGLFKPARPLLSFGPTEAGQEDFFEEGDDVVAATSSALASSSFSSGRAGEPLPVAMAAEATVEADCAVVVDLSMGSSAAALEQNPDSDDHRLLHRRPLREIAKEVMLRTSFAGAAAEKSNNSNNSNGKSNHPEKAEKRERRSSRMDSVPEEAETASDAGSEADAKGTLGASEKEDGEEDEAEFAVEATAEELAEKKKVEHEGDLKDEALLLKMMSGTGKGAGGTGTGGRSGSKDDDEEGDDKLSLCESDEGQRHQSTVSPSEISSTSSFSPSILSSFSDMFYLGGSNKGKKGA